jgi:hypothetical protein
MKKSRSPCKSGQIRNPATGRCVKRNGSIGRKILSRSKSPVRHRSPAPCKPDQIRNPDTGRCVKRKGTIGRKILAMRQPDEFCNVIEWKSEEGIGWWRNWEV